jgi:signal transduction histidine kinase
MKTTQKWSKGFDRNRFAAAMLSLMLTFGLVIACAYDTEEEDDNDDKVEPVEKVSVEQTTDKKFVIVKWEANIEGATVQQGVTAGTYTVYVRQEDKLSYVPISAAAQNALKYKKSNGDPSTNDDFDNWAVRISIKDSDSSIPQSPVSYLLAGEYQFGVKTAKPASSAMGSPATSDITWSDTLTVAKPPEDD